MLPALKPIPIKDRLSILFLEKGNLDVLDGAFVLVDKNGVRTHIPVGGVVCLMLEPGTRVSHASVTFIFKFETVVPVAFRIAARKSHDPERGGSTWVQRYFPPDKTPSPYHSND